MNQHPLVGLIGSGAMGEAIIAGLVRNQVTLPERIIASGPRPERAAELNERYGIQAITENALAVGKADVVILAVKPQKLERVLAGLKGKIPAGSVVLSIVAGASLELMSKGLDHACVVRAMPNTPAQIGQGITVWMAAPEVSPEQVVLIQQILSALGDEIQVEEENYLDMATALSGTGPAYVFFS